MVHRLKYYAVVCGFFMQIFIFELLLTFVIFNPFDRIIAIELLKHTFLFKRGFAGLG